MTATTPRNPSEDSPPIPLLAQATSFSGNPGPVVATGFKSPGDDVPAIIGGGGGLHKRGVRSWAKAGSVAAIMPDSKSVEKETTIKMSQKCR